MSTLIPPEAERRTFGSLTRADLGADAWYEEGGFPDIDIVGGRICRVCIEQAPSLFGYSDLISVHFWSSLGGLPGMDPDDELWVLRRPADFAPPSILERVPFNDAVHAA